MQFGNVNIPKFGHVKDFFIIRIYDFSDGHSIARIIQSATAISLNIIQFVM